MRNLTILSIIFLLACAESKEQTTEKEVSESETLYEQVMNLHNEVMPRMSDVVNLKTQLQEQYQDLDSLSDDYAALQQVLADLDSADEGMRNWMRNFKKPDPETVEEEVIKYYNRQKERIESVSKTMDDAIARAQELLKSDSEE